MRKLLFISILSLSLTSCVSKIRQPFDNRINVSNFSLLQNDNLNNTRFKLSTKTAKFNAFNKLQEAVSPQLILYKDNKEHLLIKGDILTRLTNTSEYVLKGNVIVKNANNKQFKIVSNTLIFNSEKSKIYSTQRSTLTSSRYKIVSDKTDYQIDKGIIKLEGNILLYLRDESKNLVNDLQENYNYKIYTSKADYNINNGNVKLNQEVTADKIQDRNTVRNIIRAQSADGNTFSNKFIFNNCKVYNKKTTITTAKKCKLVIPDQNSALDNQVTEAKDLIGNIEFIGGSNQVKTTINLLK